MAVRTDDDDLTLRVWEGDEDVLREFLERDLGVIERFIARSNPDLSESEVEDVVAVAILRFWKHRDRYDGERPLRTWICGIARNVAREVAARRLNWQKARALEADVDSAEVAWTEDAALEEKLDQFEAKNHAVLSKLKSVLERLPPLQRDIWYAYAFAGDNQVRASQLGRELGKSYENGVPIPDGTIRVYKHRAVQFVKAELRKLGVDLDQLESRR